MKNTKMPARIVSAAACGLERSKACGITSRNAAPSSAPIAYDTSIGTHAARTVSANAPARLTESRPPASVAATIQASVMHSVQGFEGARLYPPDACRHALHRLVAPEREKIQRLRIRACRPAMHGANADIGKPLPRDGVEIQQPVTGARRREC